MTAIAMCVFSLFAAAWAVAELESMPLPTPRWNLIVTDFTGTLAPGEAVTLAGRVDRDIETLGSAKIESANVADAAAGIVTIANFERAQKLRGADLATKVEAGPEGARTFSGTVARVEPLPIVPRVYVQGVVGGLVLLGGLGLTWWYVGRKHETVEFLIATDGEMKKVNWSTRQAILDSTGVVISAMFSIALVIFVCDFLFKALFTWLKLYG